ncbi:50S ribosomal protein L3 [candidate division WOR-3 bacterium]|nr:50S ribosomal protein L3 [candidate division WOR-3 bacterium]MCK4421866.1 50S ribosomal protein L3 [candidate division WOR-3 bacterium]MCK4526827.1 50S ribosomal protein L3 [candidate division WOR-3 bacterium]
MLIGRKMGMTRIFKETGEAIPISIIKASPLFVLGKRTKEKDGYNAYILGFGKKKEARVKKPLLGLCKKAGVEPVEVVREFRTDDLSGYEVGNEISVSILKEGEMVEVTGWSKGRGFQGVVKRWGFKGGPGSHGSHFHRTPGSVGAGTYPGRVLKGKKLPGRMGNERITIKNMKVIKIDEENGLVGLKGGVPGANDGLLLLRKRENKG